jgi:hypothetical protein
MRQNSLRGSYHKGFPLEQSSVHQSMVKSVVSLLVVSRLVGQGLITVRVIDA